MAEKRRLPVLPQQGNDQPPEESPPPAWHWVPLGALVTIAVGALLARVFYLPFAQRAVAREYGTANSPEAYARVDAGLDAATRRGLELRLALGALPIALVALGVGGFVVGRFGERTNARHGTLAGVAATSLLVLFAGRAARSIAEVLAYALLVPFGALVSYAGARIGLRLRPR